MGVMVPPTLRRNDRRECGHSMVQAVGICELCDIDWAMIGAPSFEKDELKKARRRIVYELRVRHQATERGRIAK